MDVSGLAGNAAPGQVGRAPLPVRPDAGPALPRAVSAVQRRPAARRVTRHPAAGDAAHRGDAPRPPIREPRAARKARPAVDHPAAEVRRVGAADRRGHRGRADAAPRHLEVDLGRRLGADRARVGEDARDAPAVHAGGRGGRRGLQLARRLRARQRAGRESRGRPPCRRGERAANPAAQHRAAMGDGTDPLHVREVDARPDRGQRPGAGGGTRRRRPSAVECGAVAGGFVNRAAGECLET